MCVRVRAGVCEPGFRFNFNVNNGLISQCSVTEFSNL